MLLFELRSGQYKTAQNNTLHYLLVHTYMKLKQFDHNHHSALLTARKLNVVPVQ